MKNYILAAVAILYLAFAPDFWSQINESNLTNTVNFLSSKELAGRVSGSQGYTTATKYMFGTFKEIGLKPLFKNYFQKLSVEYNEILAPEHFAIIKNGEKKYYALGKDYVYRGFTGSGKLSSEVVFCGYGLDQKELGYSDYENINVKNKVVLVFRYNPQWNIDGKSFTDGTPREKAIVAAKHGAVGILFVSFPNDAEPQRPIGSVVHGNGEQMLNFPEAHIDLPLAEELFSESGHSLKELQTKIDLTKKPFSLSLTHKVDLEVHTKYEKNKEVENVCGVLEGSDPILKNEYLIIGAHLDHVGSQAGKIYFPGANDNASGSAALLEIAKSFAQLEKAPKRSVIFVFFASEEQGLNGSTYFANNLPFSKEKVKAMFNLDCVGFGDSIQIGGGKSFPQLWNISKEIDKKGKGFLVSNTFNGGGADAEPFYQLGIPTLYFASTNSYKYLHQLEDTPETLNIKLLRAVAELVFNTAFEVSNL